jgi:ABC-type Fe3+/spermidine/putrescine transport system ATPase subunit
VTKDAPAVTLRSVTKRYGTVDAVKPLDLTVAKGDFLAILGPSGCGKTTLLRMIGGFVSPTSGTIAVAGQDVTRLPPEKRPTNMVFQGYGLFPHMNVRQNISYGLRLRRLAPPEIDSRVDKAMKLVRLESYADRGVDELSGGQQQRVAVARALVMEPPVLLLDEPFAALDLKLRQAMQDELKRIHREVGGTFVFVTHDQGEALALANRIAVMNEGRIEQIGSPEQVYHAPASRFVAGFIGEANLLEGERVSNRITTRSGLQFEHSGADGPIVVVVRPEAVRIGAFVAGNGKRFDGRIEDVTFLGTHVRYLVRLSSGEAMRAYHAGATPAAAIGDVVPVGWDDSAQRVLSDDRSTGRS